MTVLKVDDEKVRSIIEQFSVVNCVPDAIKFVPDGLGNWVTNPIVLTDDKFTFQKFVKTETKESLEVKFQNEIKKEATLTEKPSISELLSVYGEEIEYVPAPDIEFDKE